ncbi:MAG TPA: hypothetical protein VGF94_08075 [Kofleriaceae bacterium]|jgi:hypothetical protein
MQLLRVVLVAAAVMLCAASAHEAKGPTLTAREQCAANGLLLDAMNLGAGTMDSATRSGLVTVRSNAYASGRDVSCRRANTLDEVCEVQESLASAEAKVHGQTAQQVFAAGENARAACERPNVAIPSVPAASSWWCSTTDDGTLGHCLASKNGCDEVRQSLVQNGRRSSPCAAQAQAHCFRLENADIAEWCLPTKELCAQLHATDDHAVSDCYER